jgi:succinyl-diaminopimelate desuccinylase
MAKALVTAVTLQQLGVRIPDEIKQVAEDTRAVTEAQLGKGIGANVDHVLVNPGTIKGRVKVNIVPAHCEAEVDIRVPWGVSTEQIRQELEERLKKAGVGDVRLEFFIRNEATYTSPSDRLVQIVRDNVRLQAGKLPRLAFKPGATDVRFFRRKGVPGVNVGPRNYGMGEVNEYTTVEDVVKVTAVHAGTIIDYFGL